MFEFCKVYCIFAKNVPVKIMRNILFAFITTLILSISSFAQSETKNCPAIKMTSPAGVTTPGETMAFSVKVEDEKDVSNLKYEWAVLIGTIVEGQGTSTLKIATTREMSGANITAKVTIQGLPDKCLNELSEVSSVASMPIVDPFENYEKVSWNIEASQLDVLFYELMKSPETIAFIRIMTSESRGAKNRIKKIVKYANFREFPKRRLFFVIDKYNGQRTIIIISKELPECENCEIIKGEDVK